MAEDETLPVKPDVGEVAAARDDDEHLTSWLNGLREANDPVLKGRGGDLRFYDQVRTDAQVWAALQQRMSALVSRPWDVDPGAEDGPSEEAAARLKAELEALDFDALTRRMHWAVFYGYSVGEIMWRPEGDRWSIGSIRVRRARRFGFDVDGRLMLRPQRGGRLEATVMPEGKFWVPTTGADTDDEPYGLGLAHLCYWPAYFKRKGLTGWMTALNKFASPTVKGTFPPGTPKEDQNKLLASIQRLASLSGFIHPDGVEVGLLESSRSASMDYEKFDKRMDAWISKIVLSQTMTTDDGAALSQSKTHKEVRDEVVAADSDLLCGSFNRGPAQWWTWWNFGDRAAPPKLKRILEDGEDLNETAERDERLSRAGWRRSQASMDETYGEGYEPTPASGETPPPAAPPPELSEEEPDAIGAFVDQLIGSGAAPEAAADILAPIVEAAEEAESFEDLSAALDALTLSDDALAPMRELLAQAAFAARIGGEVGAGLREGEVVEEV